MPSFWDELKKRRVVRAAVAYTAVAWLVLQVADVILNNIESPDWVFQALLTIVALGFPLVLILSWAFALTPDGIRKESDVERSSAATWPSRRRLDRAIIAVLAIAVVLFAVDKFVVTDDGKSPTAGSETRTIAVMAFANMSPDPDQEYMSDGLAEEILNLLVRVPELRVTARASAFSFKGTDYRAADVGLELGVDHLLEGSVRRAGDRIRISAQLVEAATETQVWSHSWDRRLEDVFAIQDEVARAVVDNLRIKLIGDMPVVDRTTPDAYAKYLQAISFINQRTTDGLRQAERLLLDVTAFEPDYVPAWSQLARTYLVGSATGTWHPNETVDKVVWICEQMLERDPGNAAALVMLARVSTMYEYDYDTGADYLRRALESEPGNSVVRTLSALNTARQGDRLTAIRVLEGAQAADPLASDWNYTLGQQHWLVGDLDTAAQYFRHAIRLSPGGSGNHFYLAMTMFARGDMDAAMREIELESRDGYRNMGRALVHHTNGETARAQESLDELLALGERWTYQIAAVYAYMDRPDEAIHWLERAIERRDTSLSLLSHDPFLDNIRDDPRFEPIRRKVTGR